MFFNNDRNKDLKLYHVMCKRCKQRHVTKQQRKLKAGACQEKQQVGL